MFETALIAINCRYVPLDSCLPRIPVLSSDQQDNWPTFWPDRLNSKSSSLSEEQSNKYAEEKFIVDMKLWEKLVTEVCFHDLAINWSNIRNVMDMNAGFGGYGSVYYV